MSDVRIEHDWDKNPPVPIEQYEHTVRTQVGFTSVRRFFSAFTIVGWVAR